MKKLGHLMHSPVTGGVLLLIASCIALLWANLAPEHYHHVWHSTLYQFGKGTGEVHNINLHHITNELLMAIFFFFIGLEIKRELFDGHLSTLDKALFPAVAALGGAALPAIIYVIVNQGLPSANGWGVPMATDIAFALGVLALLQTRLPLTLKVFLSALAIYDDLAAVVVIALFYTEQIHMSPLLWGLTGILVLALANRRGVRWPMFYYLVGLVVVWTSFLASGVHATIAGVAVAFTIPSRREISMSTYLDTVKEHLKSLEPCRNNNGDVLTPKALKSLKQIRELSFAASNPLQLKEKALHPVCSLFIVPLFALGNAGVHLDAQSFAQLSSPIALGIIFGLLIGKPIGILLSTYLVTLLGFARLPQGIRWLHILGVGCLAGMGFTMSLFITDLAFGDALDQQAAKLAVLVASAIAGVIGYLILLLSSNPQTEHQEVDEH